VSRYSNIETSLAMSTPAIWCRFVRSRDVHNCYMVSRCPVSRCQSPQFWWSRDVRSRVFSRPDFEGHYCNRNYVGCNVPSLATAGLSCFDVLSVLHSNLKVVKSGDLCRCSEKDIIMSQLCYGCRRIAEDMVILSFMYLFHLLHAY